MMRTWYALAFLGHAERRGRRQYIQHGWPEGKEENGVENKSKLRHMRLES
jgi:hypothetical protein